MTPPRRRVIAFADHPLPAANRDDVPITPRMACTPNHAYTAKFHAITPRNGNARMLMRRAPSSDASPMPVANAATRTIAVSQPGKRERSSISRNTG